MVSKKVIINDEKGLHMRPAKEFSQKALEYNSRIKVKYKESEYNAKSLIGILAAGIKYGCEIEIICDGDDEEEALAELVAYIETDSNE